MRLLFLASFAAILLAAGCTPEADTIYNSYNYYYPDTTGHPDTTDLPTIQVIYPARNDTIEIWSDWVQHSNPNYAGCRWAYQTDTAIYAQIVNNLSSVITEARVFVSTSPSGNFSQYSLTQYPGDSLLFLRIFAFSNSFSFNLPSDQGYAFFVSLTTEDSLNHVGPTIPFRVVSKINYDMTSVPAAPLADTLYESMSYSNVRVVWCRRSPNVDSIFVYYRADQTGETNRRATQFYSHTNYVDITRYLPLTDYSVWITVQNEFGESLPSDTMHVTTREPVLPDYLRATVYSDGEVRLQWNNNSLPDTILVSRRDTLGDWSTIRALDCNTNYCPEYYEDTTAVQNSIYYYRIGTQFTNGVWWSLDSIGVWIP